MADRQPCPFCGGKPVFGADYGLTRMHYHQRCSTCGAIGPSFPDDEGGQLRAEAAWNARTQAGATAAPNVEALARQADCTHVDLNGDRAKALQRLTAFAALVRRPERVSPKDCTSDCRWPQCTCGEPTHRWTLVFDYAGENIAPVGVGSRDDLIAKLREDVSCAEDIADVLLRDGVWRDEGGCIRLLVTGVCDAARSALNQQKPEVSQ